MHQVRCLLCVHLKGVRGNTNMGYRDIRIELDAQRCQTFLRKMSMQRAKMWPIYKSNFKKVKKK